MQVFRSFCRRQLLPAILFFSLCCACPATADTAAYDAARAELIAAYQAQDYAAMRVAAETALLARPGYPGARFNLALAEALGGDS